MTTRAVSKAEIGSWIAARRRIMKWTQQDLGQAIADRTGDPTWINHKAAKVSKIENGTHDLSADELSLIAEIQGASIEWYYQPVDPYTAPPQASVAKGPELHRGQVIPITRRRARLHAVPSSSNAVPIERAA